MDTTIITPIIQGLPRHVAIILDGNGRWAKQQGKNRTFGHKQGARAVRRAVTYARRNGIDALTLFAFSSENWGRPVAEINVLMELFMTVLKKEVPLLQENHIQLKVIGDTSRFNRRLQRKIAEAEAQTAMESAAMTLNIAANYGGRWDITQACKQVTQEVLGGAFTVDDIQEHLLSQYMCLADLPPLDLLIRTGGDLRVSNFLLWQLAYAELYFTSILWPDFDDQVFTDAIESYICRERRFGLTSEQKQQLLQKN